VRNFFVTGRSFLFRGSFVDFLESLQHKSADDDPDFFSEMALIAPQQLCQMTDCTGSWLSKPQATSVELAVTWLAS